MAIIQECPSVITAVLVMAIIKEAAKFVTGIETLVMCGAGFVMIGKNIKDGNQIGGIMPAVSKKQQRAIAIAEHEPEKLYERNKGLLKMDREDMHDFASTSRKGLPLRKGKK